MSDQKLDLHSDQQDQQSDRDQLSDQQDQQSDQRDQQSDQQDQRSDQQDQLSDQDLQSDQQGRQSDQQDQQSEQQDQQSDQQDQQSEQQDQQSEQQEQQSDQQDQQSDQDQQGRQSDQQDQQSEQQDQLSDQQDQQSEQQDQQSDQQDQQSDQQDQQSDQQDQQSIASTDNSKSFVGAECTRSNSLRNSQCLESQTDSSSSSFDDSVLLFLSGNPVQGSDILRKTALNADVPTDYSHPGTSISTENNSHGTKRKRNEANEGDAVFVADIGSERELCDSDDNESCSINTGTKTEDNKSEPSRKKIKCSVRAERSARFHSLWNRQCPDAHTDSTSSSSFENSALPSVSLIRAQGLFITTAVTLIADGQAAHNNPGTSVWTENSSHGTKRKLHQANEKDDDTSEPTRKNIKLSSDASSGDEGTSSDSGDIQSESEIEASSDSEDGSTNNDADNESSSDSGDNDTQNDVEDGSGSDSDEDGTRNVADNESTSDSDDNGTQNDADDEASIDSDDDDMFVRSDADDESISDLDDEIIGR